MIVRDEIPVLNVAQLSWMAVFPVCEMASWALISGSDENQLPMTAAVARCEMIAVVECGG